MTAKPLSLRIYGDEVLRGKAAPIDRVTPELVELAHGMLEVMYQHNGIGLAAPQVGEHIRLVVIDLAREDEERQPVILFNPEVTPEEGENPLVSDEEGCLSVPEIWAKVSRPSRVRIRYQDETGEVVELRDVEGMLARCAQHEADHLDGVLFVDKISASDRAINASKLRQMSKKNAKQKK
jgi:peptide deformylase